MPPGQTRTERFPVVGERGPSAAGLDLDGWRLVVDGLVGAPCALTHGEVLARADRQRRVDIHCVTGWTQYDMAWTGMPLAELLAEVGVADEARFVRFEAYSDRAHDTTLPVDVALADAWLVHSFDGRPLTVEHGWPLRVVAPSRYFYKSLKWVRRVELLAQDRLGYWERSSSYHPVGDPWPGDQRFSTGSLRPAQRDAFLAAVDYGKWRGRVLIGVALRTWAPATTDLRGLAIKGSDLRGVCLDGADLSGANLSLSDLRGASLRGVSLRGADVEGADFGGADLTGADLSGAFLSATKLAGATVAGLVWDGATGLLEEHEAWLVARADSP